MWGFPKNSPRPSKLLWFETLWQGSLVNIVFKNCSTAQFCPGQFAKILPKIILDITFLQKESFWWNIFRFHSAMYILFIKVFCRWQNSFWVEKPSWKGVLNILLQENWALQMSHKFAGTQCFTMFRNVSRCFTKSQNISEYFPMCFRYDHLTIDLK